MEARLLSPFRRFLTRYSYVLPLATIALMALYILRMSWVAEDAYITFRVIDNFLHGYGLRWNVYERVQAYTHPLWMLLQIPLAAAFANLFYANILLSVSCTVGALWLVYKSVQRPVVSVMLCFLLPLCLSRAFIDYSASGLENPLGFLLFAAFGHVLLNYRQHEKFWLYISLSVALAVFNRLDACLYYIPALLYLLKNRPQPIRWKQIFQGSAPIVGWLVFSLLYYGFIFPNTKYAKLHTDIGWQAYLSDGVEYFKYFALMDMQSFLLMLMGVCMMLPIARRFISTPAGLEWLPRALGLGLLLYSTYIILVGGDYMAGRFWANPVFIGAWMLLVFCPLHVRAEVWTGFALLLIVVTIISRFFLDTHFNCEKCFSLEGKIIEAVPTFSDNRLVARLSPLRIRREGEYSFGERGKQLAEQASAEPDKIWRLNLIGMTGYYGGPKAKVIDTLGLADPLLARLPAIHEEVLFIGHYHRVIPDGYTNFLRTGSASAMDPDLAGYYTPLHLIVSGDLFDIQRLKTILLFNLGYYDELKDAYLKHNLP